VIDPAYPESGQLPLKIVMDEAATLDNFQRRESVRPALVVLEDVLGGRELGLYLWGPSEVGKSHLLQAACQASARDALYLPLSELRDFPALAVLEGADRATLVAFDDLDIVDGDRVWQEALFHLFNRRRDAGLPMLFAADRTPSAFEEMLPDLRSRLAGQPVFQLPRFREDELAELLRFKAGLRGIGLSDEVIHYILARGPRSPSGLLALLHRLDAAALARSRAVTIPLINELRVLSPDP